jgi:hypothetical protein
MLCFNARKQINQEMDGLLPARKLRSLEEHVGRCNACAEYRADLETGRRLLRASTSEPSEAFEWTLQLKLNRALKEAAGNGVPWEEPSRGPAGWLRSFAFSSLGGVAVALAFAIWVLPQHAGAPTGTQLADAASGEPVSSVTMSAGNTDRLSLSQPRYRPMSFGSSGLGQPVSGARVTQPNLLDRSGWVPSTWSGVDLEDLNAIANLREENGRLRFMLKQMQAENASLKTLLADTEINYLEPDSSEESR